MVERIIRLSHDLEARAGQVLVQLESGQVHAVDAEVFEALLQAPKPRFERTRVRQGEVDPRVAEMRDLLLRGKTIVEASRLSGLSFSQVARCRRGMVKEGLVRGNSSSRRHSNAAPTSEAVEARREEVRERRRKQAEHMRAVKAARGALRVAAE